MPDLLRDQQRAVDAYRAVGDIIAENRASMDNYKITVYEFGANLQRCGLATAVAVLERRKDNGGEMLLTHLASADIPGVGQIDGSEVPGTIRRLDVDNYILATREVRQVTQWLKRAVQAKTETPDQDDAQSGMSEGSDRAEGAEE